MRFSLDQVIAQAAGMEAETRNSLVHLAAEELAAAGVLTMLRTYTDAGGAVYDIYRDEPTGKTYLTRRPVATAQEMDALRKRLAELIDTQTSA